MTERIPSGLRPHAQPVGLPPDRNAVRQSARCGGEHVDFVVVASGYPELASVSSDVAHVGTSSSWNGPALNDPPRGEIKHTDRSRTVPAACCRLPAPIRDVQTRAIAARVKSVGPNS